MRRFLPLALAIIGFAVYANSLHGPFVFDDVPSIPDNASIRHVWPPTVPLSPPRRGEAVSGRPLVNLTFALNYAAGGLDVTGYHLVNVALHVGCGLLLFAIVRRTANDDAVAFACALLWLVHPLASEPVAYLAARTESAMAVCLLLTLYCAIRGWTAAATVACAAGMACKETMVVAPMVVALYDRAFGFPSWHAAVRARWRLWTSLAATWIVLAAILASTPRAHSAGLGGGTWNYALNQAPLIVRYLRLAVWPSDLVLDYGFPRALTLTDVWPQLAVVGLVGAASIAALVRRPRIGVPAACFLLTLAPASSLVPIVTEVGAERRMYLPLMALVVLAVCGAAPLLRRRRIAAAVALIAVAAPLSAATIARNAEYRSPLKLWQATVDRWPQGRARVNLAAALQAAGRTDEMIDQLRLAVKDDPEARYDLGAQLVARGDADEGIGQLEQFLRELPEHPKAGAAREQIAAARTRQARRLTDEAIVHATAGRMQEAIARFRQVVALLPQDANAHRNLANALLDARDYAGAAAEAREALRLNPQDAASREILAIASSR